MLDILLYAVVTVTLHLYRGSYDHFENKFNRQKSKHLIFTLPATVVANYCDECICLSVQQDISGATHAIFTKFLCMLPMSVARSSSGMFTIGHIAYRQEGIFFPTDNAL